jgi:hypothetical protein
MFIFSKMHCVCKQKQIYFFPFGVRITDILILCVLYFPQIPHTEELWLYMGTVSGGNDGRRYIPIHDLYSSLSYITCQILRSLHALTGCDTTSAFYAPATKSRGHINLPLSVRSSVRSSVRILIHSLSSYSFGATALIFCRMFIHIMEVCMPTGF